MRGHTIVIGGGPAGIGTAAELIARGISCTVLDAGDSIGSSWAGRYDGLRLHTARWLSGSPGVRIPPTLGPWVHRDDYVRYLRYYAYRRGVRVDHDVTANRVDRVDGRWQVDTTVGPMTADNVVVATGLCRVSYTPDWPGLESYGGRIMHSDAYRTPEPFRGQDVLVVGAGNSGTEIAVELLDVDARVGIAVRTPPAIVRRSVIGIPSQAIGWVVHRLPESVLNPVMAAFRWSTIPDMGPVGLPAPRAPATQFRRTGTIPILDYGFVSAVRHGRIDVLPAVEGFAGDRVRLVGGRDVTPDTVIAATGYRPGLEPLVGHLGVLDERGRPRVAGAGSMPGLAGLSFVGLSPTLAGMLNEIARQARQAAASIGARSTGRAVA